MALCLLIERAGRKVFLCQRVDRTAALHPRIFSHPPALRRPSRTPKGTAMKASLLNPRAASIVAMLAAAPLGVAGATEASATKVEASIPFGLIRDWQADREKGMWVQAYSRKWYYAEFMGRCLGLNFATAVGFDTRFQSSFDRFSSVFVPGYGRCAIRSLVPSAEGPPRKKRKTKDTDAADTSGEPVKVVSSQPPGD